MRPRWLLLAVVLLPCCTLQSLDVGRPLVVATIPSKGDRLEQIAGHYPDVSTAALERSLGLSRSARNLFDLHKYSEWTSSIPIGRLVKALNLVHDNPFAWVQLGAYLALDHQTEAAIQATRRGLRIVEEKCAVRACTDDLRRLRMTASINLSIYGADVERPLQGLLALQRIDPWDLPPFEQLAYHWVSVNVRSALGDIAGARQALQEAQAIQEPDLIATPDLHNDYPQYFGARRDGIQHYLGAVVDLAAGDLACAEEKAIAALKSDPQLWNAYLLLGNIHFARGHYGAAIATLSTLSSDKLWKEVFRPERLDYNLGNAYIARYEVERNPADLESAKAAFKHASQRAEKRFRKQEKRARLARAFDEPEVGRFFLDALATTPPVYADVCNNLGTVYTHLADRSADKMLRRSLQAQAEEQWRRALRDQYWPRRQLAYANLATFYAQIGRISSAAEAADAALSADPFNIVPLKALLDHVERTDEPIADSVSVEAVHIAGRLIAQRRLQYPVGTFDELLAPVETRLKNLTQTDDVRRALFVLDYVRASDADAPQVIRRAHEEFPAWAWPALEIARVEIRRGGGNTKSAHELLAAVFNREVPLQNWIAKREQGDALLLRAELHELARNYRAARRDIELALAAGVDTGAVEALQGRIGAMLERDGDPPVSSLAVLPFDGVYNERGGKLGHSLAWSFSIALRRAKGATVRNFERDALDVADWNAYSPVDIGRLSGIGAVLTGRYARSRKLLYLDVRVFDSVTGAQLFAKPYSSKRDALQQTQATIVEDVLAALRLAPSTPGTQAAAEAFTNNPDAYADYLAGLNILLSGQRGERQLRRARSLFQSAIRHDERFARAHAGLAYTFYGLSNLHGRPSEVMPKAEQAARNAVALLPDAAEANVALALVRTWYTWDFDAGRGAFAEANSLDPYNATTHRLYGDYLLAGGQFAKALEEKKQALELAPISANAALEVGYAFFYLGQYDKALAQADAALTLKPAADRPYLLKSWVYTMTKHYEEALTALAAAVKRSSDGETALLLSHRGVIHALRNDGNDDELKVAAILEQLRSLARRNNRYVLPLFEARVRLASGDTEGAFEGLEATVRERSESAVWLQVDPWFASLGKDKRFVALLKEIRPDVDGPPLR